MAYKEIYRSFEGVLDCETRWGYIVEEKEGSDLYRVEEVSVYPGKDYAFFVKKSKVENYRNFDSICEALSF